MSNQDDFVIIRSPDAIKYNTGKLACITSEPETLEEALELSISKWEFIAAALDDPDPERPLNFIEDRGGSTCGLCLFNDYAPNPCNVCIIKQTTGVGACRDTPYDEYWRAFADLWRPDEPAGDDMRRAALKAARAEVDFLESLRDKQEGTES